MSSGALVRTSVALLAMCATVAGCGGFDDPRARAVRICGSIRDEHGVELTNVTCQYRFCAGDRAMKDTPRERVVCNGRFDLQRDRVYDFGCTFSKDGYYPEVLAPEIANVDKNTSVVNGIQTIEMDVVMTPVEMDLPKLAAIQGVHIGYSGPDELSALLLPITSGSRELFCSTVKRDVKSCEHPYTSATFGLGRPLIVTDVVTSPGLPGRRSTVANTGVSYDVAPANAVVQLRLIGGGPTDGILIVRDAVACSNSTLLLGEMQAAPEAGYTASVDVPVEDLDRPEGVSMFGGNRLAKGVGGSVA